MTVDYAKRPSQNRESSRLSAVVFIVALLILAIGGLFGLKIHEQRLQAARLAAASIPSKATPAVTNAANDAKKNQFDFYNILPKKS